MRQPSRLSGNLASLMIDQAIAANPSAFPRGGTTRATWCITKTLPTAWSWRPVGYHTFRGNHREFHFDGGRGSLPGIDRSDKKADPRRDIEMGPGGCIAQASRSAGCLRFEPGKERTGYSPRYDIDAAVADYIAVEAKVTG